MRVIVLGGDGYLGWPTAMEFASQGHQVWVIDNYLRRTLAMQTRSEALIPTPDLHERAEIFRSVTGQEIRVVIGDCTDMRTMDALIPYLERGVPVIGLEPSCLLTFRDEYPVLVPGPGARTLAGNALLLEEFLNREADLDRLKLELKPLPGTRVLLHGHCHQKAFTVMADVEAALRLVPDLEVRTVQSSCCGMAGAFGYQAETYEVSQAMAEASLLPAVRAADKNVVLVADGLSCRHQIEDGTGRRPRHVARVLADALSV